MRINLLGEVISDIEKVIKMFTDIGWSRVDENIIEKNCGLELFPDAKDSRKSIMTIYFKPSLLEYTEVSMNSVYDLVLSKKTTMSTLTPWIEGSILVYDDESTKYISQNERIIEAGKYIKEIIKSLPVKPFHDEDAFLGYFKRPEKNSEFVRFSFYINPSYKEGYWENHTL